MGRDRLRDRRPHRHPADPQIDTAPVKLAVLKETAEAERRVAATPETVKKLAALGAEIAVEAGAGLAASVSDADYEAAGATLGPRDAVLAGADAVLAVQAPDPSSLIGAKP